MVAPRLVWNGRIRGQPRGEASLGRGLGVCCRATGGGLHSPAHDRTQSAGAPRPPRLGRTGDHVIAGAAEAIRRAGLSGGRRRQRVPPPRYAGRDVLARPGPVRGPARAPEYALSSAGRARRGGDRHPRRRCGVHRSGAADLRRDQAAGCGRGRALRGGGGSVSRRTAGRDPFRQRGRSVRGVAIARTAARGSARHAGHPVAGGAGRARRERRRRRVLGSASLRACAGRRGLAAASDDAARRRQRPRKRSPSL